METILPVAKCRIKKFPPRRKSSIIVHRALFIGIVPRGTISHHNILYSYFCLLLLLVFLQKKEKIIKNSLKI